LCVPTFQLVGQDFAAQSTQFNLKIMWLTLGMILPAALHFAKSMMDNPIIYTGGTSARA